MKTQNNIACLATRSVNIISNRIADEYYHWLAKFNNYLNELEGLTPSEPPKLPSPNKTNLFIENKTKRAIMNLSKAEVIDTVSSILSKNLVHTGVIAKVCLAIDRSGSMGGLYRSGAVQNLVDLALAVGYKFDDDGTIDVFSFNHEGHQECEAKQSDWGKYKLPKVDGGTFYTPVLTDIHKYYNETQEEVIKYGGFLGIGSKHKMVKIPPEGRNDENDNHPVFIIFITDGDSLHSVEDSRFISNMLRLNPSTVVSFLTIGNFKSGMLKTLASRHDNADYNEIEADETVDSLLNKFLSPKICKVLLERN